MKKFLVFGLGISGNASVQFLLEQGFTVIVSDDNQKSIDHLKRLSQNRFGKKFLGNSVFGDAVDIDIHEELKNELTTKFEAKDRFCDSLLRQCLYPSNPSLSNLEIVDHYSKIDWHNIECLILAAGIPLKYPSPHPIVLLANQNQCPIVCDIEILYLFNQQAKFIGITGTNGKSTTTALINHIFQSTHKLSAMGGNIGVAALSLPHLHQDQYYILEISSYQLELIDKTNFNLASLLNITPDHLDRHKDMAGYIEAKKKIFANQKIGDFAMIGIDNIHSRTVYEELKNNSKATLIPISTKQIVQGGVAMIGDVIYNNINNTESKIDLGERQFLKGEHNAQNIAFAFANCFLSGISETNIIDAIKSFEGLKHRMQLVKKIGNVSFVNDSKATNAESTENALKSFDNIYWILGGRAKEGGIVSLQKYFSKIKFAFLIGESSEQFATIFDGKLPFLKCGDLKTAFEKAFEMAFKNGEQSLVDNSKAEKTILLSPACASFDQWKNFEQRGDFFINLIGLTQNLDF